MDGISHLIRTAAVYGAALQIERSTVSWRIFGDGKKLDALIAGADIQVRRYESAMDWLSANWPPEAVWPEGVVRPVKSGAGHDATMAPAADLGAGAKSGALQ